MKNILSFLLLASSLLYCQPGNWKFQNPSPDGESNLSIDIINDKIFVCGCFGKVGVSSDGGNTWTKQQWQTIRNLFKVEFRDDKHGIIVGGKGDIFTTDNAGENWIRRQTPESYRLMDAAYLDGKTVIAVGAGKNMLRSTDDGVSWQNISLPGSYHLWGCTYNKNTRVLFACGISRNGTILRSTDEGKTWSEVFTASSEMVGLYDITFRDDNNIIATGGMADKQFICTSSDAGKTWKLTQLDMPGINASMVPEAVSFANRDTGIIAGHSGLILRTTDGGNNWEVKNAMPHLSAVNVLNYDAVEFSRDNTAYITGASGIVLRSKDYGVTWEKLTKGTYVHMTSVSFITPLIGAASGGDGMVMLTRDGGKTWTEKPTGSGFSLWKIHMLSDKNIYAFGSDHSAKKKGVICTTTDGGEHWTNSYIDPEVVIKDADFIDSRNGILTGYVYNAENYDFSRGVVYTTSDGGITWTKTADLYDAENGLPPAKIKMLSLSRILLMGELSSFFISEDGGKSWKYRSKLPLRSTSSSMQVVDENNIYVASMTGIFKSTDEARTWTKKFDLTSSGNTVRSVHFCDVNSGYAVGSGETSPNYSLIMKTTDGGENWSFEFPPTVNGLLGVFTVNDTTCYAVGSQGTIISTFTPGIETGVEEDPGFIPSEYSLSQNYPNPFNPSTVIDYYLPETSAISIRVHDILGKEVAVLLDAQMPAGRHSVIFNASHLPSGIYFYTIRSAGFRETKKMMLLK